jgi:hypothetical protein
MSEFSEWALVGSTLVLAGFTGVLFWATRQLGRIQKARDLRDLKVQRYNQLTERVRAAEDVIGVRSGVQNHFS